MKKKNNPLISLNSIKIYTTHNFINIKNTFHLKKLIKRFYKYREKIFLSLVSHPPFL